MTNYSVHQAYVFWNKEKAERFGIRDWYLVTLASHGRSALSAYRLCRTSGSESGLKVCRVLFELSCAAVALGSTVIN